MDRYTARKLEEALVLAERFHDATSQRPYRNAIFAASMVDPEAVDELLKLVPHEERRDLTREKVHALVRIAAENPTATDETISELLEQEPFVRAAAEIQEAFAKSATPISYGTALTMAARKFPDLYARYKTATGQR